MNQPEALEFCNHWLAAWTENQPCVLIQDSADDVLPLCRAQHLKSRIPDEFK